MNIGFILVDNINNKNDINKVKLLSSVGNFNKNLEKQKEYVIKKQNDYFIKYETPRKNNIDNYNKYLLDKNILYEKWNISKNIKDLYELLSLNKPIINDVPEIYTIHAIK